MRLLTDWLREFTSIPDDVAALSSRLTDIGLEVDAVIELDKQIEQVRVAKVTAVKQHPKRKDLKICELTDGASEARVVTAAPAVQSGNHYLWAAPGSKLQGQRIEKRKFSGVESHGMLCSSRELGLTEEAHTLLTIPATVNPGTSAVEALDLQYPILELDLTPNRADCLSHLGVARDFAAAEKQDFNDPRPDTLQGQEKTDAEIIIEDSSSCWAYTGVDIRNVKITRSDFEIQKRLLKMGLRPLNNIVDITNYALFEVGHPLHPFDADHLTYPLLVRKATDGEKIVTLDDEERELDAEDLLIADQNGPQALAGIMGGSAAQVQPDTKNILLEGAYFDPISVRRSAVRHKLHTEASHRFERGCDPENFKRCLARCVQLIEQNQPGATICKPVSIREKSLQVRKIDFKTNYFEQLIGYKPGLETIEDNFLRLGMEIEKEDSSWSLTPPPWRTDLSRREDLAEEIVRLQGYEQIPVTYPEFSIERSTVYEQNNDETISQFMAAQGFNENITFSFVSEEQHRFADDTEPHRLANPLSNRQATMRQSLLDGLLASYHHNSGGGQKNIRLFELGRIYPGDSHDELHCLGLLAGGELYSENWDNRNRKIDFHDIRGVIETLLRRVGYKDIEFLPSEHSGFDNDTCSAINVENQVVGVLGAIEASLVENYADKPVWAAQICLDKLPVLEQTQYRPYSTQPTMFRDLDLVVDIKQDVGPLKKTIQTEAQWLEEINIFDIYQGKPLADNQKSIGFRLSFRNPQRTLSDNEVNKIQDNILEKLREEHGAYLREG